MKLSKSAVADEAFSRSCQRRDFFTARERNLLSLVMSNKVLTITSDSRLGIKVTAPLGAEAVSPSPRVDKIGRS